MQMAYTDLVGFGFFLFWSCCWAQTGAIKIYYQNSTGYDKTVNLF